MEIKNRAALPGNYKYTIIQNGKIIPEGECELYDPFTIKQLPVFFSKVKDEKTANDFICKFGLEGCELWEVLAHAEAVRFVLNLAKAITERNSSKVISLLSTKSLKNVEKVGPHDHFYQDPHSYKIIDNLGFRGIALSPTGMAMSYDSLDLYESKGNKRVIDFLKTIGTTEEISDSYPFTKAACYIEQQINRNLPPVEFNLQIKINIDKFIDTGEFQQLFYTSRLLGIIWWQTSQMILNQQNNDASCALRACEECGTIFLQTDKRQRFCPPDPWSEKSLCGAKHRVNLYRQRKRQEDQNERIRKTKE